MTGAKGEREPRHERGSTMHGTRRVRQRLKLPARAVKRLVAEAKAEGVREPDMPGWLQIVVRHKRGLHPEPTTYIWHRDALFVFADEAPELGRLITVLPVEEFEGELQAPDWNRIRAARTFN